MEKIMLNPDILLKSMVNNPNPPYDKILVFLRNEAFYDRITKLNKTF